VSPPQHRSSAAPRLFGDNGLVLDELRTAAEALNEGDPGPFASLFAPDAEWRGMPHGHLWWKRTPS
jgi:hypothetical protein